MHMWLVRLAAKNTPWFAPVLQCCQSSPIILAPADIDKNLAKRGELPAVPTHRTILKAEAALGCPAHYAGSVERTSSPISCARP